MAKIKVKQNQQIKHYRKHLASAPNLPFVKHRLRMVALSKQYLLYHRDQFKGLESFKPLIASIDTYVAFLANFNAMLIRCAWNDVSTRELAEYFNDEFVSSLYEARNIWAPSTARKTKSRALEDVAELSDRVWSDLTTAVAGLRDEFDSAMDAGTKIAPWHEAWRIEVAALEGPAPATTTGPGTRETLTFSGELHVEDDCFSCSVERFIVNTHRASIQMSCKDDSGPHNAEASFELENGVWRTRSFEVRYKNDKSPTKAAFELMTCEISSDLQEVQLHAEWRQGGETYALDGTLDNNKPAQQATVIRLT